MPRKIEISHRTIIFTVVFLVSLWFLYFIRDILLQFFVALLIMAILNSFVTRLEVVKIPRAISILFVYVIGISLISFAVAGIMPPLIEQSTSFAESVPELLTRFGDSSSLADRVIAEMISQVGALPGRFAGGAVSLFSNIIGIFTVLIIAFYLLLARDSLDKQLGSFFGPNIQKEVNRIINDLEARLGGWVIGQLSLMLLVGVTTYVLLLVLGIPYALPLAIIAGLLEIIPYIGPIVSAIPAVIIGFGISPLVGFAVAAVYFLVQQLENYFFVPKVMQKSAGVNPIVTLLSLAIGFKIAGIFGVIMAVPVVITLQIFLKEYLVAPLSK